MDSHDTLVSHKVNPHISTTAGTETTPVPTEPITTAISRVCPKCGTNAKSGKLSCCAPGGAWFKNCGDNGDSRFNHTWFEGIQACSSGPESSLSGGPQAQLVSPHDAHPLKTTRPRNTTQERIADIATGTDSSSYIEISRVVGFTILYYACTSSVSRTHSIILL